ncbi:Clavaminate synthase-like protein [Basidiobolus meristosporus CBS 931.73]|uniref:Clavaminate synthase-like protein n=1 Tax=Basidiobolus meristosporus CBS 931.73 TaxID=1314790 RepID=A0A1Y1Y7W7_9FUNG|nr:Clavaminate synthase-like protein [Basidiobolus meristosporus CBS 931.73]|eukprot:ORX94059.1 Clavaminate synthase-like protein [Basidiobolus meristosporus CBS 931.73]
MTISLPQSLRVETCKDIGAEKFNRLYRHRRPVLLKNLLPEAVAPLWKQKTYLARQLLKKEGKLEVMYAHDQQNFMDDVDFVEKGLVSVDDVLDVILNNTLPEEDAGHGNGSNKGENANSRRFYHRAHLSEAMLNDLDIHTIRNRLFGERADDFSFAPESKSELIRLWVSTGGNITPMHFDRCHGLLLQVYGRKRFVLIHPDDTSSVYPYDGINGPSHGAKVRRIGYSYGREPFSESNTVPFELVEEILTRFPKITDADIYIVDLEPGDVLYTPPGCWHEVTSMTNSISVTVPWDMAPFELDDVPVNMAF